MKFKINKENFKNLLKKENRLKLSAALGMIGVLLIMLSEFIPSNSKESSSDKQEKAEYNISADETEAYKTQIQNELKELLEQIDGVGECSVMLTVEGTTEYVYAENVSKYTDTDSNRTSDKYENDIVFIEKDGEKQALVKKIVKPKINGVLIVCKGGGNAKINEKVINAAATALNISAGKICVEAKI